jgi:uncharacterized protein (DUF362 family)
MSIPGQSPLVAVLKTSPETVVADYRRLLDLAEFRRFLSAPGEIVIKLNLSWTKYFPACSTQPWQLDGVLAAMAGMGVYLKSLQAVENRTVVTDPVKGAENNLWFGVLRKYGVDYVPLTGVEWVRHSFAQDLPTLHSLFPGGIEVPKMLIGKKVLHLPTMKTHGHSTTTGAVKNAFGGLLREFRHYAHKHIHEVLKELLIMERELHPATFAAVDGTVAGDGAGPRTMRPVIADYLIAGGDSVAVDSVAASMMGFDPDSIGYLRLAGREGLGESRLDRIEIRGASVDGVNLGFQAKRSPVIWGDQMIRKGPLRPLEGVLLHSPMVFWAPLASNIYHDWIWYPTAGRLAIGRFMRTGYGRLFASYKEAQSPGP